MWWLLFEENKGGEKAYEFFIVQKKFQKRKTRTNFFIASSSRRRFVSFQKDTMNLKSLMMHFVCWIFFLFGKNSKKTSREIFYHVRVVTIVHQQLFEQLVQNRRFFFDEEDFEKLEETKKRRRLFCARFRNSSTMCGMSFSLCMHACALNNVYTLLRCLILSKTN